MLLTKVKGASTVGAFLAAGGASWIMVSGVMKTIGTVYSSPHLIAYIGFWLGAASSVSLSAVAFGVYRLTFIRPENVFGQTGALLRQDGDVQGMLGKKIETSRLKTYAIDGGRLRGNMRGKGLREQVYWEPHSCNMSYVVRGDQGMGLVTARCTKVMSLVPGRLTIDLLTVQKVGENMQIEGFPILVKGNLKLLKEIEDSMSVDYTSDAKEKKAEG